MVSLPLYNAYKNHDATPWLAASQPDKECPDGVTAIQEICMIDTFRHIELLFLYDGWNWFGHFAGPNTFAKSDNDALRNIVHLL